MSQGTYELPPLNVQGIASDLVMILMLVGTSCLGVAVYGACSTRRNKKWDTLYDGEFLSFFLVSLFLVFNQSIDQSTNCIVIPFFFLRIVARACVRGLCKYLPQ